MDIRHTEVSDWFHINKCNRTVLSENYKESTYKDVLNSPHTSSFVLLDTGRIVGYIIAILQREAVVYGHIISLGIYKEYRKQGYGRILMELVESDMHKIKYIILHVRKLNKPALALYTYLGYKGVKKIKYGNSDGYILQKYMI